MVTRLVLLLVLSLVLLGLPCRGFAQDDDPQQSPAPAEPDEIDLGEIDVIGLQPVAPEPVDTPEPPIEELVVEPPRREAQARVIDAEEIASRGADNVAELLQATSGFTVSQGISGAEASFQGLPSKFTTVLLDGQRIPGSILERTDLSQLRLDNVERIEVIRGPQASAFGGGQPRRSGQHHHQAARGRGSIGIAAAWPRQPRLAEAAAVGQRRQRRWPGKLAGVHRPVAPRQLRLRPAPA